MNEYIRPHKSNHWILSIQMIMIQDAEQAAATVIPWAGGKYGEYRLLNDN